MIIKDVDGVDLTPRARSLRVPFLLFMPGRGWGVKGRGREEKDEMNSAR
jgi:hypothetical protein